MELVKELDSLLQKDYEEVRRLNEAYRGLNGHILKESEYVGRLDKAASIDGLQSRLLAEVNRLKREEEISQHGYNVSKDFNSMVGFALGGIIGAMSKQNPLMSGLRSLNTELDKKAEFGKIMVTIKEEGNTAGIKIVSVSRLAREYKTTEAEEISSLQRQGYSLMTPEDFRKALDSLRELILRGAEVKLTLRLIQEGILDLEYQ